MVFQSGSGWNEQQVKFVRSYVTEFVSVLSSHLLYKSQKWNSSTSSPTKCFHLYPILSAVICCLIHPQLFIFVPTKKVSVTSALKSLRLLGRVVTVSHNAVMMSVAFFFRYVTTAFGEGLLYYIGCESWSFALTGTRSWECFRPNSMVRTI